MHVSEDGAWGARTQHAHMREGIDAIAAAPAIGGTQLRGRSLHQATRRGLDGEQCRLPSTETDGWW